MHTFPAEALRGASFCSCPLARPGHHLRKPALEPLLRDHVERGLETRMNQVFCFLYSDALTSDLLPLREFLETVSNSG